MRSVITTIAIAVALGASANAALALPAAEAPRPAKDTLSARFPATPAPPAFPHAVPPQPGEVTGTSAGGKSARAQQRYYSSYGDPAPLRPRTGAPAEAGVDWAAIGITVGGTAMLIGAVIALVMRTRRRTTHTRAVA